MTKRKDTFDKEENKKLFWGQLALYFDFFLLEIAAERKPAAMPTMAAMKMRRLYQINSN